jgi:NhaP-type Na+/H+ and K+/H+ antiporter
MNLFNLFAPQETKRSIIFRDQQRQIRELKGKLAEAELQVKIRDQVHQEHYNQLYKTAQNLQRQLNQQ